MINNGANSADHGNKNSGRVSHIEEEKQFSMIRNGGKDGYGYK